MTVAAVINPPTTIFIYFCVCRTHQVRWTTWPLELSSYLGLELMEVCGETRHERNSDSSGWEMPEAGVCTSACVCDCVTLTTPTYGVKMPNTWVMHHIQGFDQPRVISHPNPYHYTWCATVHTLNKNTPDTIPQRSNLIPKIEVLNQKLWSFNRTLQYCCLYCQQSCVRAIVVARPLVHIFGGWAE